MIRQFKPEDAQAVIGLLQELGYDVSQDQLAKRIELIQARDGAVFVYELNQQILGCINVIIDARLAEGIVAEIVSLVVSEASRGHGVGQQLVEYAETWAQPQVDTIRVRCNAIRDKAHKFYKRQAFTEKKEQKVFEKVFC
ncbi:MAG TPA: GNAT family N-acetyltransferase [Gammaproteobacteria bacterium]|nr:GNAT family N-acetyltransferase [Gammaproteobacteria bacterium]HCK94478.1 GNAT family N-acetyltransferase [Gammaproteobacteria bacterium]|tara:strand:+ start:597 stop:1016 length:420 start_codon:yes stop_codon:yes gene_type:complete